VAARWNWLAAVATVLAAVTMVTYVWLIRQQGGHLATWFLAALGVAIALGAFAAVRASGRRVALAICGLILVTLGLLALLSIGLPLLIAGVLALAGAARTHDRMKR
jgi:hypothetical protein